MCCYGTINYGFILAVEDLSFFYLIILRMSYMSTIFIFTPPLVSFNSSHVFPFSLKFMTSSSIRLHIYVYTHTNQPAGSTDCYSDVYLFRASHLRLDNLSGIFSLGKKVLPLSGRTLNILKVLFFNLFSFLILKMLHSDLCVFS